MPVPALNLLKTLQREDGKLSASLVSSSREETDIFTDFLLAEKGSSVNSDILLEDFPMDLIVHVLSFVTPHCKVYCLGLFLSSYLCITFSILQLCMCSLVSRAWNISSSNDLLWEGYPRALLFFF